MTPTAETPNTSLSAGTMSRLADCMREVRDVYPDMTVNQLLVLLLVAAEEGLSQTQVMERIDLTDGAVSRTVGILSHYGSRKTPGLDLIEITVNKENRRFQALHLTRKGRSLVNRLAKILGRAG